MVGQKSQFIKKEVKELSKIGVYPGSFDPLTYGHLDLIARGSNLFDKLYISVTYNLSKETLFTAEERKEMLELATVHYDNVEVVICDTLIADFAKKMNANFLIRGLRAITDFEYELQMASTNLILNPNVDTVFMMTKTEYSYYSSSMVKEIAKFDGDISRFVPEQVATRLYEKLNHNI